MNNKTKKQICDDFKRGLSLVGLARKYGMRVDDVEQVIRLRLLEQQRPSGRTKTTEGRAETVSTATVTVPDGNTQTARGSVESVFPGRPEDPSRMQTLKLVEQSGSLDFWDHEGEDIYSLDEGCDF